MTEWKLTSRQTIREYDVTGAADMRNTAQERRRTSWPTGQGDIVRCYRPTGGRMRWWRRFRQRWPWFAVGAGSLVDLDGRATQQRMTGIGMVIEPGDDPEEALDAMGEILAKAGVKCPHGVPVDRDCGKCLYPQCTADSPPCGECRHGHA